MDNDVAMDFILSLPQIQREKDFILMVVDHPSKMTHFTSCDETNDATQVANLYFKKVVKLIAYLNLWYIIKMPSFRAYFGSLYVRN